MRLRSSAVAPRRAADSAGRDGEANGRVAWARDEMRGLASMRRDRK
jgi:hypothetical protein